MKKGLLLSMLLLFIGVSMQAQSIAKEQMDEQFNEGPSFPLGWFGEGWTVKDGKAKCKATEDSENSGFPGGGGMGFNFDLKAIMSFTDTLFVVERSVYGKNQWVRVADFNFDMQGRMLYSKADKGLFVENGKKFINR